MGEDRWQFAVRNSNLDARTTLPAMRDTSVLLLLGEDDVNVDVDDTERVYEDILGGPCLEVIRYPNAAHELLDHSGFGLTVTAIFEPRSIFADGLLTDIERFAADGRSC
jgi:alpha-beta hydrolase superfamily lysophospholipase